MQINTYKFKRQQNMKGMKYAMKYMAVALIRIVRRDRQSMDAGKFSMTMPYPST